MPHTLVTGANSFVAAHVINELLANGHTVTGSVRRASAGEPLIELHPEWKGKLDFVIIEDYAKPGAFDAVFQKRQFDYIVHVAAPLLDDPRNTDYDRDFLDTSVNGNLSLLRSAVAYAPNLKSVVITGSINAMTTGVPAELEAREFTNDTWSDITPEQARQAQHPYISYCSSKKEAELAVWAFMKESQPSFSVTVFLPALIFGPPLQPITSLKRLNYSLGVFYKFFNGTYAEVPSTHDGLFPSFIDVRDLAYVHVKAVTTPQAANKRFLVGGNTLTASGIVKTLSSLVDSGVLPDLKGRLPKDTGRDDNVTLGRIRVEDGNAILGLQPRSAEETFGDVAKKLLMLEKEGK